MTSRIARVSLILGLMAGCGNDGVTVFRSQSVSGTVVDFVSGEPVDGEASVAPANIETELHVSVSGASFEVTGVPPGSVFNLVAGASGYRNTYSVAIEMGETDITDFEAQVVGTTYLEDLATAFGVQPTATKGVLIARAVDADRAPLAGIAAADLYLDGTMPQAGPFFLDANLQPDATADATSSSGYVVLFELDPGQVSLTAAPDAEIGVVMPVSPVSASAVTLAEVAVDVGGQVELPANISFSQDIMPIFSTRGCDNCHSGGGIGNKIGNLFLDGGAKKTYTEVVADISPTYGVPRVDLAAPENSLMLTVPGPTIVGDHPATIFASTSDPDYLKLLVWIQEGALEN